MTDASVGRSGGARLLVVDDEDRLRQTFARALTGHGYVVTEAASHADAMRVLGGGTFDLLLLDINLPDATAGTSSGISGRPASPCPRSSSRPSSPGRP